MQTFESFVSWLDGWVWQSGFTIRGELLPFVVIALIGTGLYLTFNLALVVWMMQPFFANIPREMEEAAWVDGAGVFSAFRHIILPMSAPGLAASVERMYAPILT